jgi:hypothetical protein
MKGFTPSTSVQCYIATSPSYRPQIHVGIEHIGGGNLACYPNHSARPNASLIELADGSMDVYKLGDDRNDVSLELTSASDETMQVIEEIIRRGIPVCIYPRMEGSVQASLPLIRGIGIDSDTATATHTLTLATGTLLYLPHADSGRMVYMERVANGAYPLMDGFPIVGDSGAVQCPLGRGLFIPSVAKNLLKNSNLGGVAYEVPLPTDGWRWTAGGTTWNTHAGVKASPWHDGYSYWTRSTSNYLVSNKFDLMASTDKQFNVSFCYRVSGTLTVQVYNSGGSALHGAITITSGTGRVQWPVPVISGSTSTDCTLRFTLTSGEYAEIACPQLITASPDAIGEYPAYLGSETDVQGEITASQLLLSGDFGMDTANYVGDGSTWDGYICASGYIQPGYAVAYRGNHTIAFLEQHLGATNGDVELRFRPGGDFYSLSLYTGGTLRASEIITTPKRGEAFAWVLYSGRVDGALSCGGMLVKMSTGTSYLVEYAGGIGFANRLYVGCRSTAGYGSDSILSGVTVSSVSSLVNAKAIANRLGSLSVADLFRRTAGRWYQLEQQTTPRRFDRRGWSGQLIGREVKAI